GGARRPAAGGAGRRRGCTPGRCRTRRGPQAPGPRRPPTGGPGGRGGPAAQTTSDGVREARAQRDYRTGPTKYKPPRRPRPGGAAHPPRPLPGERRIGPTLPTLQGVAVALLLDLQLPLRVAVALLLDLQLPLVVAVTLLLGLQLPLVVAVALLLDLQLPLKV